MPHRALHRTRVLDFGRYIAAPFCCQLLADLGAEVIRVERPGGEPDRQRGPLHPSGQSIYFATLNRNKKAITLNIRSQQGYALLRQLVAMSDVLVHNLPVQRAEKLGLGYPAMSEVNSRLVYLTVSGFGTVGPYRQRTAFDAVIQAMSGAMAMTGFPGQPPTLSHVPYIDFATGIFGALGVTSALLERGQTGAGQKIDQTLYATAVSMIASYGVIAEAALNGTKRRRMGNSLVYGVGGCFATADGLIVLNCLSNEMWQTLCRTIGRPDLAEDQTLGTDVARYARRRRVNRALTAWLRGRSTADAVRSLADAGIPVGQVASPEDLPADPQVQALGLITNIDQPGMGTVPVSTLPIRTTEAPPCIQRPAPRVGEHNEEIFCKLLGLSSSTLDSMRRDGIV